MAAYNWLVDRQKAGYRITMWVEQFAASALLASYATPGPDLLITLGGPLENPVLNEIHRRTSDTQANRLWWAYSTKPSSMTPPTGTFIKSCHETLFGLLSAATLWGPGKQAQAL
ncbi:MAG: hypothetical protein HC904_17355 [Blastochloris sp.]|nr:hypothetical protein [Blastochloris sp.]